MIRYTLPTVTSTFSFDSGIMKIDRNGPEDAATNVLNFQDNGDQVLDSDGGVEALFTTIGEADQPVTFTETGANTGIFTNWDDSLKTNMFINGEAARGTQATFWWDDVEHSVLNMPFWGTIEFNTSGTQVEIGTDIGAEWNSGELVEIVLDDGDMNIDARNQEQMTVASNTTIVPGVKIGSPITLASVDTIKFSDGGAALETLDDNIAENQCSSDYSSAGTDTSYVSCYEKYSERAIMTVEDDPAQFAATDQLIFQYGGTDSDGDAVQYKSLQDLKDLIGGANATAA